MPNQPSMYDRFSNKVLHMVIFAKAASIEQNVDCIYPESFLIGIFLTGENSVTSTLVDHDVDLELCIKRLKRRLASRQKNNKKDSKVEYDEIQISKEVVQICKKANELSLSSGHKFVSLGHLFLAIMSMEEHIDLRTIVSKECKSFKKCLDEILNNRVHKSPPKATKNPRNQKDKEGEESIIDTYCVNMTDKANNNEYDPIISRETEIEDAITILCRRTKSNPLLIGEAGVGKTAIVEGISQRIVSNTVPKKLRGCKIYSLNMSGMVAGTKYRGDFEKRIQDLIKAVEEDPSCILFIDEIHTIVGAGGAGGPMDAANILKPALARNLKCIGATTHQEYKKHFVDDGALSRRFGTVTVDEPSDEDVRKILIGIKGRYEMYHECVVSIDAIDSIISLTKRYRPTKRFPDKAIDCMDTACAKYAWKDDDDGVTPVITSSDIANVISQQTQIPVEVIMGDSKERLHRTEEYLRSRVIGQDGAISNICRVLKNAYSGVRSPDRPIGVMVFGGQSGTGKTYMSKEMSKAIFGNDNSLIRVDMSEYSEKHSISKIIGSPPGYVGFKDDGVVDQIKRRPYCILLLDEIEKAHSDILKLFLQVMSDGIITSAGGEKIDCKNIFFIMTGNFGMNTSQSSSIGFGDSDKSALDNERERLIDYCKKIYGDEFVNRVDSFIPFMELSTDDLSTIVDMRLNEFAEQVHHNNVTVKIEPRVANFIVSHDTSEHGMNAMVIGRMISKSIAPLVSDAIFALEEVDKYSHTLTVDVSKDALVVRKRRRKKYQRKE